MILGAGLPLHAPRTAPGGPCHNPPHGVLYAREARRLPLGPYTPSPTAYVIYSVVPGLLNPTLVGPHWTVSLL